MNIASLMSRSGAMYQQLPALALAEDMLLSYGELAERCAVIAGHLHHRYQLQPGDRVAIAAANCPEYLELYFAIWHAGLVVVPINAKLHQREFCYVLANSGARLCFIDSKLAASIMPLQAEIDTLQQVLELGSDDYKALYKGTGIAMCERADDDAAWLFYTSGTTGQPKGAMQSHRNLWAMTQCYFSDVDDIAVGDSLFHAAPMSHGGGYYMLPHVAKGAINVIPASGGFDEAELTKLLAVHRRVSMFAAPTMVKRWLAYLSPGQAELSNLKTIIYGGGPMYQQDLARAQQLLGNKLVQIYGQGECPMSICALSKFHHQDQQHPAHSHRLASVGVPMLGIEVKIADEAGNALDDGVPGEIWVRGAAVMSGYFNNPEATAQTLVDGWLKTGDMAIRAQDGFITLVDRAKDVIISGGSNIYPREVEEVLNRHALVQECSVIGKADADWGEIVLALVVASAEVSAAQLDAFCLEHIARFKRPKQYLFVDALPKNNTGKILKTELRRRYGGDQASANDENGAAI